MPFVLDASIAASWAFDDENAPLAQHVLGRLSTEYAFVPELWWFEMLNILAVNERRGRLSAVATTEFVSLLSDLDIEVDHSPDHAALLSLARRHRLSAYDAAYVELAVRNNLPLATLDRDLADAAKREGVALLTL